MHRQRVETLCLSTKTRDEPKATLCLLAQTLGQLKKERDPLERRFVNPL
jgi:hypothetical protein